MHDIVVPDFHRKRRSGQIIMNPMFSEKITATSTGGNGIKIKNKTQSLCAGTYRNHIYEKNGDHFARSMLGSNSYPQFLSVLTPEEIEDACVEASTCVMNKRGRSDSNLWETAAELHKTGRLLQNLGKRSKDLITKNSAIYDEWLSYRYGLLPIIRDTEAVLNGIKKSTGRIRKTSRCGASLSKTQNDSFSENVDTVTNSWTRSTTDSLVVRAMSIDEYTANVVNNIGFTTKGLLTLPWELIPYSFVADWFLNVGDFIGALAPAPGYVQLGSCLVWKRTSKTVYTATGTVEQSGTHTVERPWSGSVTTTHEQTSRESLRSASIVVKSNFGLTNLTRAADLYSLVGQKIYQKFPGSGFRR